MIADLRLALLGPMWERIRLGEGGLLIINGATSLAAFPDRRAQAVAIGLSLVLLASMYAVNDLLDAEADRADPKKNQHLVEVLVARRRTVAACLALLHLGTPVAIWALLGPTHAVAAGAVLLVNGLYSLALKGVPFLDVLWVGVWGGAFAAVVVPHAWTTIGVIAAMTAVSHAYQVYADWPVDRVNQIRTSAVVGGRAYLFVLGLGFAGLAGAMLVAGMPKLWAMSAVFPLLAAFALRSRVRTAWVVAKLWFLVVWIAALMSGRLP